MMEEDDGLVKAPRLCEITRDVNGYGFNLHGEKGVVGQYISAVDAGGPAQRSGICVGDRVVEVNGKNVENLSHADVVAEIKSRPGVTALLVIDKITDNYLKGIGKAVTADLVGYTSVRKLFSEEEEEEVDSGESKFANLSVHAESNEVDKVDAPQNHHEVINTEQIHEVQSSPEQKEVIVHPVKPPRPPASNSPKLSPELTKPIKPPRASPRNSPQSSPKKPERPSRPTMSPPKSPPEEPTENKTMSPPIDTFLPTSPLKARPQSIPKRKQVKQAHSDWKSKQNLFDQL